MVGTVGRLYHTIISEGLLTLTNFELLIMDEADRLLESKNEHLDHILNKLPKIRRTGLFSATLTSEVKKFVKVGMRNPYFVDV